ncbi:MAG: tryptophan 2,3-dioxygenase family protein [Chloroflexota bacterium]
MNLVSPPDERLPWEDTFTDSVSYTPADLTYGDYLKVPELLSLQQLQSDPPHHDEMLFIIIHQAYELWFKLVLHEMEKAIGLMQEHKVLRAHHFLRRVVAIFRLLVEQIHILETMTAADFLQFRDRLRPASGFQSLQFREVEFLAGLKDRRYLRPFADRPEAYQQLERRLSQPDLRATYYQMLREMGFNVPEDVSLEHLAQDEVARRQLIDALLIIYHDPHEQMRLYLLTEDLVSLDEWFGLWREHHVRVVSRIIGFRPGTGGSSGVHYLKTTTKKMLFPYLWQARTELKME